MPTSATRKKRKNNSQSKKNFQQLLELPMIRHVCRRFRPAPWSIHRNHSVRREIDPKVSQKLSKIGIDEALHEEVVSNLACVFGNNISISTLDSFGNEGLKALAESIKNQRPSMVRRKKKEILISIPHHKTEFTTTWTQGESFMQLAHDHEVLREYIEASCGGTMACCSCHIYLDENTYQALGGRPSVDERDMLDLAHEYRRGASRLGCQVQLTDELYDMDHQIVVTIPSGVNNVWN